MKCEIISVGTELLLGSIVNTNAQYLSLKMAELGIDVYHQLVVGDNFERVKQALEESLKRSDMVITTGGLGPTDDDLTKEAVSAALKLKLVLHKQSMDKLEELFRRINKPMSQCNKKQALVPEGCRVLENNNGTAPGIYVEKNEKIVIMLPGPPSELKPMFEDSIMPILISKSGSIIKSRTVRIVGIGESEVQEQLRDIFDSQTNPTIAPYAKSGEVHLRITAKTEAAAEAEELNEIMLQKVAKVLGDNIYGYDEENLESAVIKLLQHSNITISCAESCTGGLLSQRLTSVPGASKSFMNSIVTYSNEAKMKFLGVEEQTLSSHGAVSSETAYEMAEGIRRVSGTDIGVSITGIAGPDGGSAEKPVGLVYIGISYKDKTEAHKFLFSGNREKIRYYSSTRALDLIRRTLLNK
ncbi:MAG: competence/damage-inducible protein A [Bacillota bacterium]